ncbi:hypothetical protein CLV78_11916 [Aliiruegeria haliotis]|uniref:UrcA family protein n=1 Tax=Aliiruegeria haliotis TaxID=1280846 RepID=A0A2T0RER6_9RHOB|nr:hypothetical protein [Aliiruegeria haliotis]PRY19684.1 hypothetical protein CLV78_11916 [Aliiruegeria haliotis]
MNLKTLAMAVGCVALAGLAPALAEAPDREQMENRIRQTGIAIGNAFVCAEAEDKDVFREEATQLFDLILQDVGSDLAFVYAASVGYGSGQPVDNLDCTALLEQWQGIREDYRLRVEM